MEGKKVIISLSIKKGIVLVQVHTKTNFWGREAKNY